MSFHLQKSSSQKLAIFIGLFSNLFLLFPMGDPSNLLPEVKMDEYLVKFLLFASFLDVVTSVLIVLRKYHSDARKITAIAMTINSFACALYFFITIVYSNAAQKTRGADFLIYKAVFGGIMCGSTIILESILWVELEGSGKQLVPSNSAAQRNNNGAVQKNVNNINSRA